MASPRSFVYAPVASRAAKSPKPEATFRTESKHFIQHEPRPLRAGFAVSASFNAIVGRFSRNDHIVHVAFAQAGVADAHKLCLFLKIADGCAAQIAHAGAQAANQLEYHGFKRPAVWHAPLDTLRNKLGQTVLVGALALHNALAARFRAGQIVCALEITLARTLAHGGQRAHAAIALEAAALIEDSLAGAFVHACKERPDHHRAGSGGNSLCDLA